MLCGIFKQCERKYGKHRQHKSDVEHRARIENAYQKGGLAEHGRPLVFLEHCRAHFCLAEGLCINKNTHRKLYAHTVRSRNFLVALFVCLYEKSAVREQIVKELRALSVKTAGIAAQVDAQRYSPLIEQILDCRDECKVDSSTDSMDFFNKMPRWLGKFLVWILTRLDVHGWIPASIIETDPYYCSVVLSNLGSIKLKSGYHHLTNWGTCSMFCIIGEKKKTAFFDEDGTMTMRETLDLGLTIDERLADGYYYSKSVRLLKYLLEHPEELEKPIKEEVDYE